MKGARVCAESFDDKKNIILSCSWKCYHIFIFLFPVWHVLIEFGRFIIADPFSSFFSIFFPENYKLVLFMVNVLILIFILLIFFYKSLIYFLFIFSIPISHILFLYLIIILFIFIFLSFCKTFINFQYHPSIQIYDILFIQVWSSFFV